MAGPTILLAVVKLLDKLFKYKPPQFLTSMREKAAEYRKAVAAEHQAAPAAAAPGMPAGAPEAPEETAKAGDSAGEPDETAEETAKPAEEAASRYFIGDVVRLSNNVGMKYKGAEAIVTKVTAKQVKVDVITGDYQHQGKTFPASQCTLVLPSNLRDEFGRAGG